MKYEREFTIRANDVVRFQQGLMLRGSGLRIVGIAIMGVVIAWLYVQWLNIEATPMEMALWMSFTTAVTMVVVFLSMVITNRKQTKKHLERMGKDSYQQKVLIDVFGIHVIADGNKSRLGFEKVMEVRENRHAFYIYLNPIQAWILPKDQMEDVEGESRQIREIFDQVIESRRLKFQKQK